MIGFYSCKSGMSAFSTIDLTKTKSLIVSVNPFSQQYYDTIPSNLNSILITVDKLIAKQESSARLIDDMVDFTVWNDLLFMTLEQDDNSLFIVTIYIVSNEEGFLRCIRQSPEDIQTVLASFHFDDPGLIRETQAIRSAFGQ